MVASFELKNEWVLRRCGEFRVAVEISLNEKEIILGRGQNRGVRYPLGVSRRHALVTRTASDQWKIKDLGSTNGLFINSTKVDRDSFVLLREYDVVGLGIADATCEDHYSFMLCRRIKIHHYKLPELLGKTKFSTSAFVRDDQFPEKEELVDVPTGVSANVENCGPEELTDDDICIVSDTPKNDRKQKTIVISDESDSSDIEIICITRKRRRRFRGKSTLKNCHRRDNELIKIAKRHQELSNCESTNLSSNSQIPCEVNRTDSSICVPDTSRPGKSYLVEETVEVISSKFSERSISVQASQTVSSFNKCNGIEKVTGLQYCGVIEILDDADTDPTKGTKSDKCSALDTEGKSLNDASHEREGVPGLTTYHGSNDYELPIDDTVDDSFVQDNSGIGIDEDQLRSRIVWSTPDDDCKEHTSFLGCC